MTTGERIRNARVAQNMTQKELAKRLGISPQGIVQWENGSRHPKTDSLKRIAAALDVSYWELAGIPDTPDDRNLHHTISSDDITNELRLTANMILNDVTMLEVIADNNGKGITPDQREQLIKDLVHLRSQQFNLSPSVLLEEVRHYSQINSLNFLSKNDLILKEILEIFSGMNLDGEIALLHHARELGKISDYQKNY